jgi:type I restriction enzyme S subunit
MNPGALAELQECSDSNEPWAIPPSWTWRRLGDVAIVLDHRRVPINSEQRAARCAGKAISELFPYYGATGQVGWIDGFLFEGDHVLLGEDGAPFLDRTKPKAYLASGHYWVNNHAHILETRPSIELRWLLHVLNWANYEEFVGGTTRLKLTQTDLVKIRIPVAPLREQRRIVARIDELFAEIDEGEAALERARQGLDTWRRALLKAAVTGELTRDWREANRPAETGADLLARIGTERDARTHGSGRRRGSSQRVPMDTISLPTLPEGWVWASLGDLFEITTGSTPSRAEPSYWGGTIPWVSSGEVAFCRIKKTRECVTRIALRGSSNRIHQPGTVLLAMIGEGKTRGQCAILDIAACNNQNSAAIRVGSTSIEPQYIYYVLQKRYYRSRKESQGQSASLERAKGCFHGYSAAFAGGDQ